MIDRARQLLTGAKSIVSFTGAGLSAESGMSTFRDTGGDSLWSKFDPMQLASPQGFAAAPDTVMDWYAWRRRVLAKAKPNPAHEALGERHDIMHITQNVDDLLERAGACDVVHLHGTVTRDRCNGACGFDEQIELTDPPGLRACPACGDQMRPAVVWFGESLPRDAWEAAERACASCDALLVVGTSAVVYPAAGLIAHARAAGASIIVVNTQPSEASHLADAELIGPAGEIVPRLFQSHL